jgi:hypothetical protein
MARLSTSQPDPDLEVATAQLSADKTSNVIDALIAKGDFAGAAQVLQVYQGLRALRTDEATDNEKARLQANSLLAIERAIRNTEAAREACSHQKESGRPDIGAMRDSSFNVHYICLACQRLWKGAELPEYLRAGINPAGGLIIE